MIIIKCLKYIRYPTYKFERSPIFMKWTSPRITALYHTLLSFARVTLPVINKKKGLSKTTRFHHKLIKIIFEKV